MATTADDATVILSIARTPMGAMQGALAEASATDLGATAVKAAVERAGVSGEDIDRIYMGCVLPAGLGQAPARQAAIKAGLPTSVQATTVNKVCGSGMQTVIMGAEAIGTGNADVIVAGGMESMTNAPYLLKKHRSGARIGHDKIYDHMFLDGLEDAYEEGRAMGSFAQATANDYQLTRAGMDAYAIESLNRATEAGPGKPGDVLSGTFVLDGTRFMAINGGPVFPQTEAVSFMIHCKDQDEVDRYWTALGEGGEHGPCGWLKDRFGLSWQVIPARMNELLADPDPERASRSFSRVLSSALEYSSRPPVSVCGTVSYD